MFDEIYVQCVFVYIEGVCQFFQSWVFGVIFRIVRPFCELALDQHLGSYCFVYAWYECLLIVIGFYSGHPLGNFSVKSEQE